MPITDHVDVDGCEIGDRVFSDVRERSRSGERDFGNAVVSGAGFEKFHFHPKPSAFRQSLSSSNPRVLAKAPGLGVAVTSTRRRDGIIVVRRYVPEYEGITRSASGNPDDVLRAQGRCELKNLTDGPYASATLHPSPAATVSLPLPRGRVLTADLENTGGPLRDGSSATPRPEVT